MPGSLLDIRIPLFFNKSLNCRKIPIEHHSLHVKSRTKLCTPVVVDDVVVVVVVVDLIGVPRLLMGSHQCFLAEMPSLLPGSQLG